MFWYRFGLMRTQSINPVFRLLRSAVFEYGPVWLFFRTLYALKIRMMRAFGFFERLYERKVQVSLLFDFGIDTTILSQFLAALPEEAREELTGRALDAAVGKIMAFHSILLDYGHPIDWHLNPMTHARTPNNVKWFRIADFDSQNGDVKVIWEASRFSQFILFARAYLLTHDDTFYRAFSDQLANWLEENPYSFGVNHKCGQEASLRLINALLAASVFRAEGILSKADENNLRKLTAFSYQKVLSNFFYAHKCIRNNHTLSELCGMILGAWCCGDERTMRKAFSLLEKVISKQFFEDGGYVQYSFNYQRVALQVIACILRISQLTGVSLSQSALQRIYKSAVLMHQCQTDIGDVPNYGSNDGALFFPLTSCGYRDFRPIIGLIMTQTAGFTPFAPGPWDEELLWLTSGANIMRKVLFRVGTAFDDAGLYTLRQGDLFVMTCLNRFFTRPSHMDQLHVDVWFRDQNVFCDAGTYSYAESEGRQLALTASHNTVFVSPMEQMSRKGPFFIYDWTRSENCSFTGNAFSGKMVSANGYSHRRKIAVSGLEAVIEDRVESREDACEYRFHTPFPVDHNGGLLVISLQDGWQCLLETSGEISVEKSRRSLYYYRMDETNCICIRKSLLDGADENRIKMTFERTDEDD